MKETETLRGQKEKKEEREKQGDYWGNEGGLWKDEERRPSMCNAPGMLKDF